MRRRKDGSFLLRNKALTLTTEESGDERNQYWRECEQGNHDLFLACMHAVTFVLDSISPDEHHRDFVRDGTEQR